MSIKLPRSKSAPHSVISAFTTTPLKGSASHADLEQKHFRHTRLHLTVTQSPVHTPRVDKEDPFNLGTFFPTTPLGEEEEHWAWLRGEERDINDGGEEDSESAVSGEIPTTPGPAMLGELHDELTREAIEGEDKLGVLSLNTLFDPEPFSVDDRLFSPYTEDEAVDMDSLCMALCARRQAPSDESEISALSVSELFLPTKSDIEDSWSSIFWKVIGF